MNKYRIVKVPEYDERDYYEIESFNEDLSGWVSLFNKCKTIKEAEREIDKYKKREAFYTSHKKEIVKEY